MHERINHFLNRPFPLFLAQRKGRFYFCWLIIIFVLLANILQPFGLDNHHEFHKALVLSNYILVFFGMYAVLYMILSFFDGHFFSSDSWTIRKELRMLLFYIPVAAFSTYVFSGFAVPDFELSLPSFIELQYYNGILSAISIPVFGYFVDTRLNPAKVAQRVARKENRESGIRLTEPQAQQILHTLHEAMETQQLYLSRKCSVQYVAAGCAIPAHHISWVINTYCNKNFSDFVHEYRCRHACRLFESNDAQRLTIEAIGAQCGFRNRVNFYYAFKKVYGKSPSNYLKSLPKES